MDWDFKIFTWVNSLPHSRLSDGLMMLTSQSVLPLTVIFLAALFVLAFFHKKDFREVFFLTLSLALGFGLVVGVGKGLVARPRPYLTYPAAIVVDRSENDFSFPSGHSFAIAAASVLIIRKKESLLFLFLPLSVLVGFSRVYLGVHYPADVLVGLGLGYLYGLLVNSLIDRFLDHRIFKILKFHLE